MATAPRSMFRLRYRTILLWLALGMILWSGFSYWKEYSENSARRAREMLAPPLGAECIVILEGTETVEGRGEIVEQSDRWIVLQQKSSDDMPTSPGKQLWIPRERVLLIQFDQ